MAVEGFDSQTSKPTFISFRGRIDKALLELHQGRPINSCAIGINPFAIQAPHPIHRLRGAHQHLLRVAAPQLTRSPVRERIHNGHFPTGFGTRAGDTHTSCASSDYYEIKFLFIHIPKTAGNAIQNILGDYSEDEIICRAPHQDGIERFEIRNPDYGFSKHTTLQVYTTQLGPERLETLFTFTCVRNPWDRVHSWYRNVIRDPIHQKALGISATCSFVDFVKNHLDCWALDRQIDWLVDINGDMVLDYIGKFETLQESFIEIGNILGLKDQVLPNVLRSDESDFRSAYTDQAREIVAAKYAEEIKLFNYEFD